MFGYTNGNAREFTNNLWSYLRSHRLLNNNILMGTYSLKGGDKLDILRINGVTVLIQSGNGKSQGIEQRLEIYLGAENSVNIDRALTTLTEMTGKEFSRGRS